MNAPNLYPDIPAGSRVTVANNNFSDDRLDPRSGLSLLLSTCESAFVFDFEGTDKNVDKFVLTIQSQSENIGHISYYLNNDEDIIRREIKVDFSDSHKEEVRDLVTKFGGKNLRIENSDFKLKKAETSKWPFINNSQRGLTILKEFVRDLKAKYEEFSEKFSEKHRTQCYFNTLTQITIQRTYENYIGDKICDFNAPFDPPFKLDIMSSESNKNSNSK